MHFSDKHQKKFDIILVGATGFVGSRFLNYYGEFFKERGLKVMATARNLSKLQPEIENFPDITPQILDLNNQEDVFNVIKQGALIINFAGPFDIYGEHVVAASAKFGSHYLDITGETHFAKRMIQKYQKTAKQNNAMIVPFAGFDSVPSDYGVFLAALKMEKLGEKLKAVDIIYSIKGEFNGGTIATAIDTASKMTPEDQRNRNYLVDDQDNPQPDANNSRYIEEIDAWVAPFFMEPINSKNIYRSVSLQKETGRFANDFQYRESLMVNNGNRLGCYMVAGGLQLFSFILKHKWSRGIVTKFKRPPGSGPSDESIETGYFKALVIGRSESGKVIKFTIGSQGDPGNRSTIKILGATMKAILGGDHNQLSGIITPSIAFGENLVPYLDFERVEIQYEDGIKPAKPVSQ